MNYHKVSEQDRIKFELSMLFTVIEESYNNTGGELPRDENSGSTIMRSRQNGSN